MNFTSGAAVDELLSIEHIRGQLIRLEDTIIFSLIERAQFAQNTKIYQTGEFPSTNFPGSWLDWFLFETESFHDVIWQDWYHWITSMDSIDFVPTRLLLHPKLSITRAPLGKNAIGRDCDLHPKARRYTSPDEYPFTPIDKLPPPIIPVQQFPSLLYPPAAALNVNDRILDFYINRIVPGITAHTDDGNYGSAATRDVEVLQALSRRIHYGMFVSESKFLSAPHDFIPHIRSRNTEALAGLITKPQVEAKLLVRLENKANVYGGEMDADGRVVSDRTRINVGAIVDMYREHVIPLTKDVEVDYLLRRLDNVPQEQIDEWLRV